MTASVTHTEGDSGVKETASGRPPPQLSASTQNNDSQRLRRKNGIGADTFLKAPCRLRSFKWIHLPRTLPTLFCVGRLVAAAPA
jgi:hypothetical protein